MSDTGPYIIERSRKSYVAGACMKVKSSVCITGEYSTIFRDGREASWFVNGIATRLCPDQASVVSVVPPDCVPIVSVVPQLCQSPPRLRLGRVGSVPIVLIAPRLRLGRVDRPDCAPIALIVSAESRLRRDRLDCFDCVGGIPITLRSCLYRPDCTPIIPIMPVASQLCPGRANRDGFCGVGQAISGKNLRF